MNYIIKPAVSLFVAAAITVAALSFVYNKTYESIEKQKSKVQEKAMKELLPNADGFNQIQAELLGSIGAVYRGHGQSNNFVNNNYIGYILKLAPSGYSGEIDFLVGVSTEEQKVTGIRILRHSETPGLGALSVKEDFYGQFSGRNLSPLRVTKSSPGKDEIQAITSATITSRAITNAVNEAIEWVLMQERQPEPKDDWEGNDIIIDIDRRFDGVWIDVDFQGSVE
jgi:Na+-translocating ferredoxin:NAD+ oxidoreductase subunit G